MADPTHLVHQINHSPRADAFITLDERLAEAVKDLVTIVPIEALG